MASSPAPRCSISMPLLSSPSSTGPKPRPPPPARKPVVPNLSLTTDGPVRRTALSACQPTGWGDPTTFFPGYPDHFQIFLDRDSNYVVIWYLILSHHLSRASRDPARTTPQAAPLCNLCVRRLRRLGRGVGACPELLGAFDSSSLGLTLNLQLSTFNRVSFPSSHLSLSQRAAKSFTIRTSKTPLPQLLYNPHLQAPLGSAGNTGLITPLESALTENSPVTPVESALTESGGWGSFLPLRNSPYATRHYPLCSSPFFSDYSTLFCTFLYISKTQPICFHAVPRSLRKTPGCGGGTLIFPTINAFSSARSPRALPLTLAPAPTYNPAVSSVASQSNFISGSNRMKKSFWMCAAGIVVLFGQAARVAAQAPEREAKAPEAKAAEKCDPATAKEESSVTEHSIKIGGQTIPYKATASTTLLKNEKGESTGLMYSAAYTRSDVKDLSTRPLSFLYNGGPGSATMWLHMGAFGPRRAYTVDGTFTPPAPYKLVDNPESLLDKTDLVFIDAMGTGYSHAVCKAENKDFYGIDEDVEAFAQFIVTYLSRNGRWNSPKFLIGESYGTFRSAALGNFLQSRDTVHLNGIVLISSVLDLSSLTFSPGDDRPFIFYLPSYAATAWYHKILKDRPADLPGFIEEARKYAQGEYATALFKGAELGANEKAAVAKKVSYFTGLSEDYLTKADLRVNLSQFRAELQRSSRLTTGRIDARFTGYTYDLLEENAQGDPEGPAVGGAFTALINSYNHDELKFGKDKVYHNTSGAGGGSWNWTRKDAGQRRFFPGAPNVDPDLAQAMITNPRLQVQVENGYFDLATPFFATEFTMEHLGLPEALQKKIKEDYYNAGHMMYLHDQDRVSLHNQIAGFIDRATRQ